MIANGRSPGQRRRKLILDVKIGPTSTDHWTLAGLCSLMSRLTLTDSYIAFRLFITLSLCLYVCVPVCVFLSAIISSELHVRSSPIFCAFTYGGGSVAEWLGCWTQAQKGPGSNRSRDAVG